VETEVVVAANIWNCVKTFMYSGRNILAGEESSRDGGRTYSYVRRQGRGRQTTQHCTAVHLTHFLASHSNISQAKCFCENCCHQLKFLYYHDRMFINIIQTNFGSEGLMLPLSHSTRACCLVAWLAHVSDRAL
jgi:hypothetical protein